MNIPSITYDFSQLFEFTDQIADSSCLVYQKTLPEEDRFAQLVRASSSTTKSRSPVESEALDDLLEFLKNVASVAEAPCIILVGVEEYSMELLRERLSARDKLLLSQLVCGHTNWRRILSLLSLPGLADADLEEFRRGALPSA